MSKMKWLARIALAVVAILVVIAFFRHMYWLLMLAGILALVPGAYSLIRLIKARSWDAFVLWMCVELSCVTVIAAALYFR